MDNHSNNKNRETTSYNRNDRTRPSNNHRDRNYGHRQLDSLKNNGLNPYHFVPVDVKLSLMDTPVWHDGANNNQKELLSGELLCTMETLTPTIVGNNTYKIKDSENRLGLPDTYDETKTVIEPLRLDDGRVVIPGTSIKGMLRHSLSALLSAPMERVQEQEYGYRPNSQFGSQLQSLPVIITGQDANGDYQVKIMKNPIFVKQQAGLANDLEEKLGQKITSLKGSLESQRVRKLVSDNNVVDEEFYNFKYFGGVDGCGELAEAFRRGGKNGTYKHILIKGEDFEKSKEGIISKELFEHYKKTLNFIKNDTSGHLSSRHPNSGNHSIIKNSVKNIKETIENAQKLFNKIVFFVERDSNKNIITMGHNFRYLVKYADSIYYKNSVLRNELAPLNEEQETPFDKKGNILLDEKQMSKMWLTAGRLLFGYAQGEKDDDVGTQQLGGTKNKDTKHLAGRIAINHAIEVTNNPKNNSRFLDNIFLKELGSPKASAVEFYINQNNHATNQLNTYGDDLSGTNAGELNGRKFYLHQPDAVTRKMYASNDNEEKNSKRSSIARFVSKPETKFKFTLKYKDLRWWELAILKFVLEMKPEDLKSFGIQSYLQTLQTDFPFTHKLGYAKPLGFGSVKIRVDNIEKTPKDKIFDYLSQAFGDNYDVWKETILLQWLKIHQYEGRANCSYRIHTDRGKTTIFNYHSKIRQHHLSKRKGGPNKIANNIDDVVLKKLSIEDK